MAAECKRGDIFLINWNPARGSEQAGIRPAVVIQNDVGNVYSPTTIVAACSASITRAFPFIVKISAGESGLDRDTAVNLAQIMTVGKDRLVKKIGRLPAKKMTELDAAIANSLGLS